MAETYCGKSCAACDQKELLHCPGCKDGPGRHISGDCELAQCCREKGHETCDTCGFHGSCALLQSRFRQPEYRKMKNESAQRQREEAAERAVVLGKWLWILFWLVVPGTIAGIMKNENVMDLSPGVYLTGQILNAVCAAAYGIILLKLSPVEDRYRIAGILSLAAAAAGMLPVVIFGASKAPTWSLLITIPAAFAGLVREYYEYNAHASVLMGADNDLSEKWLKLWKWFIRCMLGMIGSVILLLIAPFLGSILLLAASIGLAIVSIAKLVYLYRTAKVFRGYSA